MYKLHKDIPYFKVRSKQKRKEQIHCL